MTFTESDINVIEEASTALVSEPHRYTEFQSRLPNTRLATVLTGPALQACSSMPEARKELNERGRLKGEHKASLMKISAQGGQVDGVVREFVEKARGYYGAHGTGTNECPLGNALLHDVAIPYANKKGIKELIWDKHKMSEYMHKYSKAVDDLQLEEFELSEPMTGDSRIRGLEKLEIRDQPSLHTITSDFCDFGLTSFEVTNCDLTSLPTESFQRSKNLRLIDLSGNKKINESLLNEALSGSSVEKLVLNDMNLTAVPSVVARLTNLKSLEMKNCPLKKIGQLPSTLTSLDIEGHDIPDVQSHCRCKHLEHLDISSTKQSISAAELTRWANTSGCSRMRTLFYTCPESLSEDMKETIQRAMPVLEKCKNK